MNNHFQWCITGAGPAGIAAAGKLLDAGVAGQEILWVDPAFTAGDLGSKWHRVQGNTKVKTFLDFFRHCKSFDFKDAPEFAITGFDPDQSCRLGHVAEVLKWITNRLRDKLTPVEDTIRSATLRHGTWQLQTTRGERYRAKQVILTTGSEPDTLPSHKPVIPVETALNDRLLRETVQAGETIGVFGASHSAIVALENLLACDDVRVINFYRHPLKYAVYFDDFTLFDDTGLKGHAAQWARENIDGKWPGNLERILCGTREAEKKLDQCTQVVFTIGFSRRAGPVIEPFGGPLAYNRHNGIIAPGLFGAGIAYPNMVRDPFGNEEYNVGMWKFMKHLDHVLPLWMRYHA